jgi:hypothetical protein
MAKTNDKTKKKQVIVPTQHVGMISNADVQSRIIYVRDFPVIVDADVAEIYGVETKRVNEAVRNNPDKFPEDYMFELTADESRVLRSKISSLENSGKGRHSKYNYKAFTEKGLYMLATVLKSKQATAATFAIIETFAKVRYLKRELKELHQEPNKRVQMDKMHNFGEVLSDIIMPDLETVETESSLELNFFIGKIKHTVRRIKKASPKKPKAK